VRIVSALAGLLRPTGVELQRLVDREVDPRRAGEFEQLCPGPVFAILALAGVAVCALVVAPFRVAGRLLRRA
jgi:hypothetical protein